MAVKSFKSIFLFLSLIFLLFVSCEQRIDNIVSTRDYTLSETNNIISWQLPGVNKVKYHLQISENFTFTKLIIDERDLKAAEYKVPLEKLVPYQKYFWRVIPNAPGGIWSQPKELFFVIPTPDTL